MGGAQRLPFRSLALVALAAGVGILGGLGAAGFRALVDGVQMLCLGQGGSVVSAGAALAWWQRLLAPTAGGLLAGCVLLALKGRPHPFGIGDMVVLVATRRERISARRSFLQVLSSALSIGSGGSIGREGPIVQVAATFAAMLVRFARGSTRVQSVLIGCGVAAGMAASYNAPIAAALFAMEVVLGNFAMDVFAPVVVSSVLATLVAQALFGTQPLYPATDQLTEWHLVLLAVLLGAICGLGGIALRRTFGAGRTLFARVPGPLPAKMALGGLLVGCIGLGYPEVWGNGYENIAAITATPPIALLTVFAILFWKPIATAVTTGSGALGGVFTPTLVVGAAFGAFFAASVHWLLPGLGDHRSGFALVGMAGLCAATTHAPISSIVLVFELTRDYGLILPLMLCCIVASVVARLLERDSIYTARLRGSGSEAAGLLEDVAMRSQRVADLMLADAGRVRATAPFVEVMEAFREARRNTLYVVDDHDLLLGTVHIHDVKNFLNDPTLGSVVIATDLTRRAVPVRRDESLAAILERFADPELDELPVVESAGSTRLVGRITRRDLIAYLHVEVVGQRHLRTSFHAGEEAGATEPLPEGCELARVPVDDAMVGRALDSLDLQGSAGLNPLLVIAHGPDGTTRRTLAEPTTVLAAGDQLVVLGTAVAIAAFQAARAANP
ncbi:MAG: chloride channel protein [Planctomycetes bacterium]|nr:chloride channel protein [Planctomycetota bacterium]